MLNVHVYFPGSIKKKKYVPLVPQMIALSSSVKTAHTNILHLHDNILSVLLVSGTIMIWLIFQESCVV